MEHIYKKEQEVMELTIKELAPYLPYGLKIFEGQEGELNNHIRVMNLGKGRSNHWIGIDTVLKSHKPDYYSYYRPILRSLSDLIKDEYWKELLSLLIEKGIYKSQYAEGYQDYMARIIQKPFGKIFKLQNHDDWVIIISLDEPERCKATVYNWLIENHFDVFGLIDKNLAIDSNTIK